jgi:tetratricopeptide (TPR) repeat protein
MSLGRHDEAIREMQIAQQLDPVSSQMESGFGRVLYRARKYEESIPHFLKALALDPQNYSAYVRLGDVNAKLGRYDEAISAFEKAGQLRTDGWDRTRKARVYALMGKQREARQLLSESKSSGFETASVYAALGDLDGAFRILEKAVSDRNSLLVYLKEEPTYDSLHSDPRWKELLRRMNYPAQ